MRRFALVASCAIVAVAAPTLWAAGTADKCVWSPWMSWWGQLSDYIAATPGQDWDPTNWDYLQTEPTLLDADGRAHTGQYSLHFFVGNVLDPGHPEGQGSGGVYQEITAVRGTPIDIDLWWKGIAQGGQGAWWEVIVVDGPFSPAVADTAVDPANLILKYDTFAGPPWLPPSSTWMHDSATWDNWSTSTPAEPTTVTIILKTGLVGFGPNYFETYFDDVSVTQDGGANLVVNGDFEDAAQAAICQTECVLPDPDNDDYYLRIPCDCDFPPLVLSITPSSALNTGPLVGASISGINFVDGITSARLRRTGQSDIVATNVSVTPDGFTVTCDFDITGAAPGDWDLVVGTEDCPFPSELISGFTVTELSCNATRQDTDGDADVDLADFGTFLACFNGPSRPWPGPPVPQDLCACLDQDGDNDVDLSDFGVFLSCFNGPSRPPACP